MDRMTPDTSANTKDARISVEDQTHHLIQVYLVAGWAVVVFLGVVMGLIYRTVSISRLINAIELENIAFTQEFSSTTWAGFEGFVKEAQSVIDENLQQRPETASLREAILTQIGDRPVVRVRLYGKNGMTVFSTKPEEIGQYTSDAAVRELASGRRYWYEASSAITEVTRRKTIEALDGEVSSRDLVASLVPLPTVGHRVEAMLEVIQDVTPETHRIARLQTGGMVSVFLIATALLLGTQTLIRHRR